MTNMKEYVFSDDTDKGFTVIAKPAVADELFHALADYYGADDDDVEAEYDKTGFCSAKAEVESGLISATAVGDFPLCYVVMRCERKRTPQVDSVWWHERTARARVQDLRFAQYYGSYYKCVAIFGEKKIKIKRKGE